MTDSLQRATELLAGGREREAIDVVRELLTSTTDPSVVEDVHALAVEAHEASHGFLKIEWQRLVFDAEARTTTPAR
jgi:hypothetical protein